MEEEEEAQACENSQNSAIISIVLDHNHDISNHGSNGIEPQHDFSEEEIRGLLEITAATGKFWHEWGKLKGMISFYLNQVLSQYPEAKLTIEQQISSMGETFLELVKRLDDALRSFIEGPPFTLQRLCEVVNCGSDCLGPLEHNTLYAMMYQILLAARSIYPKLSKLALALEKNLLVTSMLTISTDPYPLGSLPRLAKMETEKEDSNTKLNMLQNGVQPLAGDGDEIMTEVEEAEVDEVMTVDMKNFEEIVGSSETNSTPNGNSKPAVV